MSTSSNADALADEDLIPTLERAVKGLQGQRERDQELFQLRQADLLGKEEALQEAIERLNGFSSPLSPDDPSFRISEERYNIVLEYLRKHGRSRQADIARAVKDQHEISSGTVSVALRKAEAAGEVARVESEDARANTWDLASNANGDTAQRGRSKARA